MVNGDTQSHIFKKEFAGQSVLYKVENKIAHITLNRPERYNAIDENTPVELERAVQFANMDDDVKVLCLRVFLERVPSSCTSLARIRYKNGKFRSILPDCPNSIPYSTF